MFDSDQALHNAKMQEISAALAAKENEGKPQLLTLPDGTVIPSKAYVPGAKQVIDTRAPSISALPGAPPPGLQVPPGWVWNGKTAVPDPNQRPAKEDDVAQLTRLNHENQLNDLNQKIAAAQGEVATGNQRGGPDWLPFTTPYADQIKQLQARRDALLPNVGTQSATAPAQTPSMAPPRRAPGNDNFIVGKKYRDADGNEAVYAGNGQWQ